MKPIRNILLLLLAFIVAAVLYFTFRKDQIHTTEELREMFETEQSHYSTWRGKQIHYVDQGEGRPVVFIHGFGGSFANWDKAMANMPAAYRLIAVDLPGFGLSDAPEFAEGERFIDLYSDMVAHLMQDLSLDSMTLVGNSLGGYISWEAALRYPENVERLVLVNSAGYDMDELGGPLIRLSKIPLYDWIVRKGLPYRLALIAGRKSVAQRPDKERIRKFFHLINRQETMETVAAIGTSGEIADTSRIPLITQPTLIIWGEADHIIEVDHAHRFHRDIPNSELVIYKLIGHVPMIENPELFTKDVVEFLED